MFYFVPSWYSENRKWYHNLVPWYRKIERMEFDDMINQLRMFDRAGEATQLILLNYSPQLRYFLHRQELLDCEYWSVFDFIQNIDKESMMPFDFLDLDWPQGTNFIYTSFAVLARRGEELLAQIEFAEEGNIYQIRWFKKDAVSKEYIFDDRGFVSSILYFDDAGEALYQDYLNTQGIWQIREWLNGKGVEINPHADRIFKQLHYNRLEEVIQECLRHFLKDVNQEDIFIASADPQHHDLLVSAVETHPLILSLFHQRNAHLSREWLEKMHESSVFMVSDSERTVKQLQEEGWDNIYHISPYDTRLRLGSSQQIKELKIYLQVDQLSEEDFRRTLLVLAQVMRENLLVDLIIGSYHSLSHLMDRVNDLLEENDFESLMIKDEKAAVGENDPEEEIVNRIFIEEIKSELDLIQILEQVRLIIDLGEIPDLYTQIAGISAGIPQINQVETSYIQDQKNGLYLSDLSELPQAIAYYFDELKHWNESLVYSVNLIEEHKNGKIVERWKHYLRRGKGGKETERATSGID